MAFNLRILSIIHLLKLVLHQSLDLANVQPPIAIGIVNVEKLNRAKGNVSNEDPVIDLGTKII